MIDFSSNPVYDIGFTGGPQPPPATNPSPGLPPAGSPFYQWPNPIQGAEDWILGAAAGLVLPLAAPFALVGLVLLVLAVVVVGMGSFGMGLVMGDDS